MKANIPPKREVESVTEIPDISAYRSEATPKYDPFNVSKKNEKNNHHIMVDIYAISQMLSISTTYHTFEKKMSLT